MLACTFTSHEPTHDLIFESHVPQKEDKNIRKTVFRSNKQTSAMAWAINCYSLGADGQSLSQPKSAIGLLEHALNTQREEARTTYL